MRNHTGWWGPAVSLHSPGCLPPSVPWPQCLEGQTPPPTQDLESPPHPEAELLLPAEISLTGQSAEGASWSRGSAAIRRTGEEGTLTLGLHPWGEDPGGWTGFGPSLPALLVGACVVFWWLLVLLLTHYDFPDSSVGKESACNAGDPGSIPGSERSVGEGIGYPGKCSWASLVAQLVKNRPAMWETWVRSLRWEGERLEKGKATHSSILVWRIPWTEEPGGLQSMGSQRVGHDWSDLAHMNAHGRYPFEGENTLFPIQLPWL